MSAVAEASEYCTNAIIDQTEEKKQLFVDAGCEIIQVDQRSGRPRWTASWRRSTPICSPMRR